MFIARWRKHAITTSLRKGIFTWSFFSVYQNPKSTKINYFSGGMVWQTANSPLWVIVIPSVQHQKHFTQRQTNNSVNSGQQLPENLMVSQAKVIDSSFCCRSRIWPEFQQFRVGQRWPMKSYWSMIHFIPANAWGLHSQNIVVFITGWQFKLLWLL